MCLQQCDPTVLFRDREEVLPTYVQTHTSWRRNMFLHLSDSFCLLSSDGISPSVGGTSSNFIWKELINFVSFKSFKKFWVKEKVGRGNVDGKGKGDIIIFTLSLFFALSFSEFPGQFFCERKFAFTCFNIFFCFLFLSVLFVLLLACETCSALSQFHLRLAFTLTVALLNLRGNFVGFLKKFQRDRNSRLCIFYLPGGSPDPGLRPLPGDPAGPGGVAHVAGGAQAGGGCVGGKYGEIQVVCPKIKKIKLSEKLTVVPGAAVGVDAAGPGPQARVLKRVFFPSEMRNEGAPIGST